MRHQPPKWADRFLEWYCNPDLLEDLQGDLHEVFESIAQNENIKKANRKYIWLVLRSLRISAVKKSKSFQNFETMSANQNFKIAWRVLRKNQFNTVLNLVGLSIGIICFLLMGLFVIQETSYDEFHNKKDRIYRSWLKEDYGEGRIFFNSITPLRFETLFEESFPEVETAVQFTLRNFQVGNSSESLNESIGILSPEFFKVFDFQLINGNLDEPLAGKKDLIISSSYAKKYFGDQDPIGKSIGIRVGESFEDFVVSAVLKDIQKTSSIQFDLAISNANNSEIFGERTMNAWFTVAPETYILIKENGNISTIKDKMQDVILSQNMSYGEGKMERDQYFVGLQPITDIHLNPGIPVGNSPVNNPKYVYILGVIGTLVLIIACINYTTLSIGQSLKRAREVGMRKVLGAKKPSLMIQYLSESILVAIAAMAVGGSLAIVLIPTFNWLTNSDVIYQFEWIHLLVFLSMGIFIGIVAGLYPVLVLSNTRVMAILQDNNASSGKHWIRKVMVVFQFLITVFLISSTLIMRKQLNYLHEKDLGYSYEATVSVPLYADPSQNRLLERINSAFANGELIKSKLEQYPEISGIAIGSHVFGTPNWANLACNDNEGNFRRFRYLNVDANYLNLFEIPVVEGRPFEKESGLDQRQSMIINHAAVEYFGLVDPIGKKLPNDRFGEHKIIGITDNFHFSSLHNDVEPLVITENPMIIYQGISDGDIIDSPIPKLIFKYNANRLSEGIEILEKEWDATFPSQELNFSFVDEDLALLYQNEAQMNRLVAVSTTISIIIAAIGLLGLTVLIVNSREKEIGIRKVMGASPSQIFVLLGKSFSLQLFISIILSIPITIWLMQDWLESFAYRTSIGVDVFLISTMLSVIMAIGVISYHTMKAARVNPVKSLRSE